MKNRSHRFDVNRPKPGYNYKKCLDMMLICIKHHLSKKFMKNLSNTEAWLKKHVAYKKACTYFSNSLIIQAIFHEVAKYVILHRKMELI